VTRREEFYERIEPRDQTDRTTIEDLELDLTKDGRPKGTLGNILAIFSTLDEWVGRFAYNAFTNEHEYNDRAFTDSDETRLAIELEGLYGLITSGARAAECARLACEENRYHPIQDKLKRLVWDETPRVNNFLPVYFRSANTKLCRAIGRCWLISAVARVFDPGCKVDTTLILAGKQGTLKSSALRTLAMDPEWFSDSAIDVKHKDAMQGLSGVWIKEFAELEGLRARDAQTIKAFMSGQVDHFRPAYGRNHVRRPRQNVFVGTTNELTFLSDVTGSRRFWPVLVAADGKKIELDHIARDAEQLWAEAVELYQAGAVWWLDDYLSEQLVTHSEEFRTVDPWEEVLGEHCKDNRYGHTTKEFLDVLEVPVERQNKSSEMRVAAIMKDLGWSRGRTRIDGDRRWRWNPPPAH
tara:strand:+ start:475 stop:1704 length:1230 start_codon:yes stop_codon:yes gene_type:complete